MHVADRQQFFAAFSQPLVAGGGRAANLDGIQYAQMEPRQPGSVLCDEAVAVLSDDVGHLEGWPVHGFCSFRERWMLSGLDTGVVSSGFWPLPSGVCVRGGDRRACVRA